MKFNYLIKAIPFLSTLLLIICLNITNQKENTKLRILIWDTPSLSLATYITISTATGFILSYLLTNNLAKVFQAKQKESLRYRYENNVEENINQSDTANNLSYDNNLIERDIKDPLPTINASFRIIGRKEINNRNFINNNIQYDESTAYDEQFFDQTDKKQPITQVDKISNDWNDESYSRW